MSPFGDHKRSVLGRENRQDISTYLQRKSVWIGTAAVVSNAFIMRSAKSLEALVSPTFARAASRRSTQVVAKVTLGNSARSTHAV